MRGLDLVLEIGGDPVHFSFDLLFNIGRFIARADQFRVGRSKRCFQLSHTAQDLGPLGFQTGNDGGIEHLGNRINANTAVDLTLHVVITRTSAVQLRLKLALLCCIVSNLLFGQRSALRRQEAGFRTEFLNTPLLGLNLITQTGHTLR